MNTQLLIWLSKLGSCVELVVDYCESNYSIVLIIVLIKKSIVLIIVRFYLLEENMKIKNHP